MASGFQTEERVPENMKKKLALAVRSIQWSYAIFWSISARQPGVLEWGDGFYNGDIKTRKTLQAVELNADQLGLQRSEQLRDLYESLSAGEASPQSRRPSVALTPEDLSDTEWYYLVCMSFVFNIGQGLPGRTLANGEPIWLCNAHLADSKVFSRSLLAKSASIQTLVCFPFLGGVVELGVTDLVLEDPGLIQHIRTSFLEIPYPASSSKKSLGAGITRNANTPTCALIDQDILVPHVGCEELDIVSLDNSSNGFEANPAAEASFMVDGMNGGASQVQSWQFMDDELSNCLHQSMNSSDCISQTFVEPGKAVSASKAVVVNDHCLLAKREEEYKVRVEELEREVGERDEMINFISRTSGVAHHEFGEDGDESGVEVDVVYGDLEPHQELNPHQKNVFETDLLASSASKFWAERASLCQDVQYDSLESLYHMKHFVPRRESPWKVDGDSTGVSSKLKLLEQELENLVKVGKSDLSRVPSLLRKQAKRYQALGGKIDDLCRRMQASDPSEPTLSPEFRTQRQTEFLLEGFRLQQRATETGQKFMAIQTEVGKSYCIDELGSQAKLTTKRSLDSIINNLKEIQRNLEIWLARIIGDLEGILARDGASRVREYYISRYPFVQ